MYEYTFRKAAWVVHTLYAYMASKNKKAKPTHDIRMYIHVERRPGSSMLYMCKGAGGRQAKEEALALYVLSFHFEIVGTFQVDKLKTSKRKAYT